MWVQAGGIRVFGKDVKKWNGMKKKKKNRNRLPEMGNRQGETENVPFVRAPDD